MQGVFWTAFVLTVIGSVNWALVGVFNIDLVSMIFGQLTAASRIIYTIIGFSAVYVAFAAPSLRYERPLLSRGSTI